MSLIDKNIINRFVYGIKDALKIGSSTIVGIDIGLSAVKVAEVVELKGGRYKLTKYSMIPLSEGALIEDEIQKEEEIIEAIREALVSGKISSKIASIAISGPNTVVRKLQLAGGSNDEIEDQVLWEAEQYLPFDIDSSTVSSHLFGENLGGGVDVSEIYSTASLHSASDSTGPAIHSLSPRAYASYSGIHPGPHPTAHIHSPTGIE